MSTDERLERRYTNEEREEALRLLVVIGNSNKVGKQLGIPARTVREWRETHAERFLELSQIHKQDSDRSAIAKMRELTHESIDTSLAYVRKAAQELEEGRVKDAAGSAYKLMYTGTLPIDKIAALEGRPTVIIQHQSAQEILKRLGGHVIDGEAEEITDDQPRLES